MRDALEQRVLDTAQFIIDTGATVRTCARRFGVSKTTVHKDMRERLPLISPALAIDVGKILQINKADRHIRGGAATRLKYAALRKARQQSA